MLTYIKICLIVAENQIQFNQMMMKLICFHFLSRYKYPILYDITLYITIRITRIILYGRS